MLTGVNDLIIWFASVVLTAKYQLVASSMQSYIIGDIDSQQIATRIKLFYTFLVVIGIVAFGIYVHVCLDNTTKFEGMVEI